MIDSSDPKSKWLHWGLKLVAAIVIFKVGVMVGEFRIIKKMVLGTGNTHPKMLFRSGDNAFFEKGYSPMMGARSDIMMWKGERVEKDAVTAPVAPIAPAP